MLIARCHPQSMRPEPIKEEISPARRAHAALSAASGPRGLTGPFQPLCITIRILVLYIYPENTARVARHAWVV